MIELYAISDDPSPPAPPLRAVACGDLTALCAPAEEREVDADALWRHEEVVEQLMEERNLLPVRFGTVVRDEPAAVAAVLERREELVAALARVRGAVELAVRATGRLEGFAAKIHEPLAALARDSLVEPESDPLRAAYLVDRDAMDHFVAAIGDLQRAHPEIDLLCTGPWPPYSFSEGAA